MDERDVIDGDRERLADLIDDWLDRAPRQLAAIAAAVGSDRAQDLAESAHLLGSASASLGVLEVSGLARRFEDRAGAGVTGDRAGLADLEEAVRIASDQLRAFAGYGRDT